MSTEVVLCRGPTGHRSRRNTTSLRTYILITVACGLLTLLVQVLFEAPSKMEEYADERIKAATRDAIKAQAKEMLKEQKR